jgi:hypothetical protein
MFLTQIKIPNRCTMKPKQFTREELYNLLWKEPLSRVAKKYGITDKILKKACMEMNIPLPDAGYWSKLKFGKVVVIPKLSENYSGKESVDISQISVGKSEMLSLTSPLKKLLNEIENDKRLNLKVPSVMTNPELSIAKAKEEWESKEYQYRTNGVYFCGRDCIDVKVSLKIYDRALRIMDTIIKALRGRGHEVQVSFKSTCAIVLKEKIGISIREKTKKDPERSSYYSNIPTGILAFRIGESYYMKEWKDGKIPLEKQISFLIATIEMKGIEQAEERKIRQKENAIENEKERIKKEYQQRKLHELENFKFLMKRAKRRFKAEMLREFIDDVELKAIEKNSVTNELKSWIKWARKKADWYDPFVEAYDKLLHGADRESLSF